LPAYLLSAHCSQSETVHGTDASPGGRSYEIEDASMEDLLSLVDEAEILVSG
jgi:hypothetical protein